LKIVEANARSFLHRSLLRSEVAHSVRLSIVICIGVAAALGALALITAGGVHMIEETHPPPGRFVEVEAGRLHVLELGPPDGPPVVLLHGAGTNLEDMRLALGDRLAASFRVILIDRPGHGWSDRPGGSMDASPSRQAKLTHQALAHMGIKRAVLVAHSWSGALATAYALDYPESVSALVLLAPVTHPWPMTVAWQNSIMKATLATGVSLAAGKVSGPLFVRTLVLPFGKLLHGVSIQSAFAPQTPPRDYLAQTAGDLFLRPSEFTANAEDISHLRPFLAEQAQKYAAINKPTVILVGELDEVAPPEIHARPLAKSLARSELVVLPGIGHMLHFASSQRVIEAIARMIKLDEQYSQSSLISD
jgi:pimeloyl-ACP methyl ester carboxylesterase